MLISDTSMVVVLIMIINQSINIIDSAACGCVIFGCLFMFLFLFRFVVAVAVVVVVRVVVVVVVYLKRERDRLICIQ